MCNAYRSAIQYLISNAIHVVDRFHVVQVFLKAVDYARHVIYETMKSDIAQIADPIRRDNEYRQLMDMKIDTFMFRKNPENMNDYRLFKYKEICEAYPEFAKPAWGRDNFMKIHDCDTLADAEAAYRNWKMLAPVHLDAYKKIKSFISHTMKNWRKEIFNYFVIDGKRKTNATTERLNGAIKICRTWGGATYIRFCGPKCFLAPRLLKSRFMNAY
ncbi:transposase [Ruminococcaceae bacterium OttesenSCG-928-O06]|nr:transposase [Ruminococcaceae bacterium OttesenSCG-928-O06]